MRVSTYEIILPLIGKDDKIIEGKALLVNGLYGALDVVDEATASKLREERFAEIPFALRERLTQRGHITRKDEAGELADAQLLGRVWRKLIGHSGRGPVILPTYNCNFRCPYCFERHRLTRGQEWLGHEMNPEMVDAVFAALQKQREQGHKVNSCGAGVTDRHHEWLRSGCLYRSVGRIWFFPSAGDDRRCGRTERPAPAPSGRRAYLRPHFEKCGAGS